MIRILLFCLPQDNIIPGFHAAGAKKQRRKEKHRCAHYTVAIAARIVFPAKKAKPAKEILFATIDDKR
ncbi:MAG: hypothetical protein BGP14_13805 [Sphingobacteriales bacterium 44-15]|nr:MAG: hypothetical protein BGP14_13805 [Sphingobacteriales bacterium 44-15]